MRTLSFDPVYAITENCDEAVRTFLYRDEQEAVTALAEIYSHYYSESEVQAFKQASSFEELWKLEDKFNKNYKDENPFGIDTVAVELSSIEINLEDDQILVGVCFTNGQGEVEIVPFAVKTTEDQRNHGAHLDAAIEHARDIVSLADSQAYSAFDETDSAFFATSGNFWKKAISL